MASTTRAASLREPPSGVTVNFTATTEREVAQVPRRGTCKCVRAGSAGPTRRVRPVADFRGRRRRSPRETSRSRSDRHRVGWARPLQPVETTGKQHRRIRPGVRPTRSRLYAAHAGQVSR